MKKQDQAPQSGVAQTRTCTPLEKPQAEHQTIVPSEVAQTTLKVLSELEIATQAAVALVMMNADMIQEHADGFADWEDLTVNGFQEGVVIVARMACEQLRKTFLDWDRSQQEFIPLLLAVTDSLPAITDRNFIGSVVKKRDPRSFDSFTDFEIAWGAVDHLLHMQGWIMEPRSIPKAFQLCDSVRERLKAAWESAALAYQKLVDAFAAVEMARMKAVEY